MKILLSGGSGTLGSELIKVARAAQHEVVAPGHISMPIDLCESLEMHLGMVQPDVFVHCAAAIDVGAIENNPAPAIATNVIGTSNVVQACINNNIKLIYISTDYVFDGTKGQYSPEDPLNPISKYAKTKTAGELVARTYDNCLVIRTSFFGHEFPHPKAFIDQWSSKDYVDIIAPKILSAIESDRVGIVHVGSNRRSLYDIAKERKPDIQMGSIESLNRSVPIDVSLIIDF